MLQIYNQRLEAAKKAQVLHTQLWAEEYVLLAELSTLQEEAANFKNIQSAEQKNIQPTEKFSIFSFLVSFFVKKPPIPNDQNIKTATPEADTSNQKYSAIQAQIALLEEKIQAIQAQKESLKDWESDYAAALACKELILLGDASFECHAQLLLMNEQIQKLQQKMSALNESLEIGEKALKYLRETCFYLERAYNSATWDTIGVFGAFSDINKHSHLTNANSNSKQFQYLIKQFKSTMQDNIYLQIDTDTGIGSFWSISDFLFDGLFVDLVVRDKINNALARSKSVLYNLSAQIDNIRNKMSEAHSELAISKATTAYLIEVAE